MTIYIELGALIFMLFLFYLIMHFLKDPLLVIFNSIFGIVGMLLLNTFFHLGLVINFWSVAIVALGGIGGLVLVLILHFLEIAF
jgi:hypothetical protein